MKEKKQEVYCNVKIIEAVSEGYCIAKINDLVVFVPFGAPGDVVDIRITHKRKKYRYGEIINFHSFSEERVAPFCSHYGLCGGCKWQHLSYSAQLAFKQKQVYDALYHIGKTGEVVINPIFPSTKTQYYRNKLEFTFSDFRWMIEDEYLSGTERNLNGLGFHLSGKFDRIVDINKCFLQADPSNQIRNFIRDYAIANKLSFYNIKKHTGLLRNLLIRNSLNGGLMVVLVVSKHEPDTIIPLLNAIRNNFNSITSLNLIVNDKFNEDISDREVVVYNGNDHLIDSMGNMNFVVGVKSFYQTNSEQAYNLYKIVKDFASLSGKEIVYDLYSGTGTIANFVADKAEKVIGIEYLEQAVTDARQNSLINNVFNTAFFAGDMQKILDDNFIAKNGKPDVVITDPPRAGMHPDVISTLLKHDIQKIVYVSCNPSTQARDVNMMLNSYGITKVQPIDMFPHTQHVENVILLERKV